MEVWRHESTGTVDINDLTHEEVDLIKEGLGLVMALRMVTGTGLSTDRQELLDMISTIEYPE